MRESTVEAVLGRKPEGSVGSHIVARKPQSLSIPALAAAAEEGRGFSQADGRQVVAVGARLSSLPGRSPSH